MPPLAISRLRGPWLLGLLLLGCGLASVVLGPDRSWDLRNYHLYVPWALLHDRPGDLVPGGLQSFHNPSLDLPFALLLAGLNDWPWLVAFLMGLPAGLALWLLWALADRVFAAHPDRAALALLALAAGAGGAVWRSQVGGTAGDATSGVLVLAALLPALAAVTGRPGGAAAGWPGGWAAAWRGGGLAGLLCGLAIGLKLTNAPQALALAAMLAVAPLPVAARLRLLLACAAGGALGVVLGGGWWAWQLWQALGNPIFPYFHDRFDPAWGGTPIGRDLRFLPAAWWEHLVRPFRWALSTAPLVTEERMRDPRLAAGLLAAPVLLVLAARRRALPGAAPLAVFFLVGFAAWSLLFSIYRYAFVQEQLAGLLLLAALAGQRGKLAGFGRARLAGLAALLLAAAVATAPVPALRGLAAPRYLELDWPVLAPGAMVLQVAPPTGYLAAGLPPDLPMVSIYGVGELGGARFRAALAERLGQGRPLYVVSTDQGEGWERLALHGLAAVPESCRRICTNWSPAGVGPVVCAVRRPGEATPATPRRGAPAARLCAALGPGFDSAGRRGMRLAGEGLLDFGPGCAVARLRLAEGEAESLRAAPPLRRDGAALLAEPDAAGLLRLVATRPVVIAEAACLRTR